MENRELKMYNNDEVTVLYQEGYLSERKVETGVCHVTLIRVVGTHPMPRRMYILRTYANVDAHDGHPAHIDETSLLDVSSDAAAIRCAVDAYDRMAAAHALAVEARREELAELVDEEDDIPF
jgi:hypothetical protein